ncbi:hypothetical protein, partial [Mycobacteroides abscessus]
TLLNNLTTYDKTFGVETMCVGVWGACQPGGRRPLTRLPSR